MENEAADAIKQTLRDAASPQTLKNLQKLLRSRQGIAPEVVTTALTGLVHNHTVYQWPAFRRATRYWHCLPDQFVRDRIVELASNAALTKSELLNRVRKVSHGCSEKFVDANVRALFGEGKIVKARTVGQSELLYASGKVQALIASSIELLKSRLLRSGISPDQLTALLQEKPSQPATPLAGTMDGGTRILTVLRELESSPGMPVTARELRARVSDLTKDEFDRAVIELASQQRVYVTRHDHGWALSESDRQELIHDGGANLYVAVATRR